MLHYTHSVLLLNLHLALGHAEDHSGNFERAIPKSIGSFPKAPFFICDLKTIWWAGISPCICQIHFPLIIFGLWQYGGFRRRKHKAHDLL